MIKPEIVEGLRNALERGYSIEIAKQSFINSGYNRQDVDDSARSIGYGATISNIPVQQPMQPAPQTQQIQQTRPMQPSQARTVPQAMQKQAGPTQFTQQQMQSQFQQPIQQSQQPMIQPRPTFQPPVQQPMQQMIQPMKQPFMPVQKKSKKGLVVIIILSLILIFLIAALITTIASPSTMSRILSAIGINLTL